MLFNMSTIILTVTKWMIICEVASSIILRKQFTQFSKTSTVLSICIHPFNEKVKFDDS